MRLLSIRFKLLVYLILLGLQCYEPLYAQTFTKPEKDFRFNWIQTARVFLMDAYQPPFAPVLEYNADTLAKTMVDMDANVVRIGTMGKYAMIQGINFTKHPSLGNRDILQETIDACKPKGIKVIPYISTGHKLGWSMVTNDFPEYGQKTTPNGIPDRSHMYVGEDHGTVCWMGPYRDAYLKYVEHVVRDYEIDGIYFDSWKTLYFWPDNKICYCEGCVNGFRKATGLELPYHEKIEDYTADDQSIIDKYHQWYKEEYITKVVLKVHDLVKSYKDIPMICNIENPHNMVTLDPRIINAMDAFLYERGNTILERAEGVGVPRSVGLHIWPYVGVYHNWPRLAFQGVNYQQEIFTNLMFGGGSIIAQPTGYIYQPDNRKYIRYPFRIIKDNENLFEGLESNPYVGVVFATKGPDKLEQSSWNDGLVNSRTSTLGAFSACLYNHIQVSSISDLVLDDLSRLKKYPVIYLANIPHLSADRIKNITEYVNDGGSLIVSYSTSLYDENGTRKSDFDLAGLLGVSSINPTGDLADIIQSYQSMTGGPNDLYLSESAGENGFGGNQLHNRLYPLWFFEPVEVKNGGELIMNIVTGPDQKSILPGVVVSKHGKGKVLYCASALESLFQADGQNMIGELVGKFIETITTDAIPYKLDAPASLIANLTNKKNCMVLQMTNWTGNKFEHPLVNEYYLAPVENVRLQILVPENKKVKKIYTLVDGEYTEKMIGKTLEMFFTQINSYQAVVVEFE